MALAVVVIPVSGLYAVSYDDGTIRVVELATNAEVLRWKAHEGSIIDLAVNQSGDRLASVASDRTVKIRNLANGDCVALFQGDEPFWAVAMTPDGRLVIAGDASGQVHFLGQ